MIIRMSPPPPSTHEDYNDVEFMIFFRCCWPSIVAAVTFRSDVILIDFRFSNTMNSVKHTLVLIS